MDASFQDWEELPGHIVDLIVTKLDGFSDYTRFCGVCPQWRYIAHKVNPDYKVKMEILAVSRKKLPMLMFSTNGNSEKRSLFSVSNRKTYDIKLPLPYKYNFVGSSSGWLVCVGKDMALTLVNPCNNACVSLPVFKCPRESGPSRKKNFEYFFTKVILLSGSHSSDQSGFYVAVLYGGAGRVAFYKYGEPSWNFVDLDFDRNPDVESKYYCQDIVFYKGKLYATNMWGKLIKIDTTRKTMKTIIPQSLDDEPEAIHLVESQDGELLMLKRWFTPLEENDIESEDLDDTIYSDSLSDENSSGSEIDSSDIQRILDTDAFPMTVDFKVFKMTRSLGDGYASWREMDNIGEQALFLGDNQSMSVSTIEFRGCLKNSIYFTSEHHRDFFPYAYRGAEEDARIFNLEDKSLHYHHVLEDHHKYMHPPIWFVLNPQELNSGR